MMDRARQFRHPRLYILHHQPHRIGAVDHEHHVEASPPHPIDEIRKVSTDTPADAWTLAAADAAADAAAHPGADAVRRASEVSSKRSQPLNIGISRGEWVALLRRRRLG